MKYHKLIAGETTGTYAMESPITEADILQMAQQLAMSRLSKGRALTEPRHVFIHLQTLLQYHEHEVFALLLLDKLPLWLGLHQHMYAVGPGEPQWGEGLPLEHTIYLTELLPYDGVAYPSSQLQFLNHVP